MWLNHATAAKVRPLLSGMKGEAGSVSARPVSKGTAPFVLLDVPHWPALSLDRLACKHTFSAKLVVYLVVSLILAESELQLQLCSYHLRYEQM